MDAYELFEQHQRFAYFQAHRWRAKLRGMIEWDDLKQLCLMGLYQAARTYKPERGSFTALATMCIANAIRMEFRVVKKRYLDIVNSEFIDTYLRNKSDDSNVAASVIGRMDYLDMLREIEQAIDRLPVKARKYIRLHYVEGYTQTEIGAMYGIVKSGVSIAIMRALKKVRKEFKERGREYANSS